MSIDYEAELNDRQLEAVKATEGPVLILAGAGSGKTRAITFRTAYLIEEKGVKPWNIMALTFTNKAAAEMKERIMQMSGQSAKKIWVSTFHSTCLRILFAHAEELGYSPDFEIADQSDQKSIIKEVCKNLQIDTKTYKEKTFLNTISSAKDELLTPELFAERYYQDYRRKIYIDVYQAYQDKLRQNNSMDFDDLIMNTVRLFKNCPKVLEHYQDQFLYIMVDEYQDTNTAQFELIRLLASKHRNLCVVGDDDQSIYRFRGANIRNILDFEEIYRDAKVIKLEQNYRSTETILTAANQVISNNRGRKRKELWTDHEQGKKIRFRQLDSAAGEAAFIADDIKNKVAQHMASYKDFAILMRTNVQSKEIEDAFRVRGIDYDLVKGLRFWDTKVIKDVTALLLTAAYGENDLRTIRIINIPKRGVGPASIEKLQIYAEQNGISLLEACGKAKEAGVSGKAASALQEFYQEKLDCRKKKEGIPLAQFLDLVLQESGYMDYLNDEAETPEDFNEKLDYIEKLKDTLIEYEDTEENPDLMDFMRMNGVEGNNLDRDSSPENPDKVLIMTMHNAKGLEFPFVYMVGMEEGLFPGYASINSGDEEDIEEERRLCYVAITRAQQELTLTCARIRMMNGETRYAAASRFIKELPFGLLDMNIRPEKTERPVSFSDGSRVTAGRSPERPAFERKSGYGIGKKAEGSARKVFTGQKLKLGSQIKAVKPEYVKGDRVRHFKFGEGTVLDIIEGGRDFEVTVEFDSYGVRKMFAGFAKLKKI